MVDIAKTPFEELQQAVKDEMAEALRDAAEQYGCHPEQLRIRVVRNNLTGACGYEVSRMPDDEVEKAIALDRVKRARRKKLEAKRKKMN